MPTEKPNWTWNLERIAASHKILSVLKACNENQCFFVIHYVKFCDSVSPHFGYVIVCQREILV